MAEAALVVGDQGSSHSPLVSVSFQKNEQRKFKFLEGEPKALGITQICLSIFHISCVASLFASGLLRTGLEIPALIASLLIVVAGSLAIAAKNLHLPTLRACLGLEIVAGVASLFNAIVTLIKMSDWRFTHSCYDYHYSRPDDQQRQYCNNFQMANMRLFSELAVMQVALFAISITLLVYAAKVANCCSPAPKMPVITIQAPPAPQ